MNSGPDNQAPEEPRDRGAEVSPREAAMREVLQVISDSRGDETPVFDAILRHSAVLSESPVASLLLLDDTGTSLEMAAKWTEVHKEFQLDSLSLDVSGTSLPALTIRSGKTQKIDDLTSEDSYVKGGTLTRRFVDETGFRSLLSVPLILNGTAIGCIDLFREKARAFEPQTINMIEAFAAHAVIAIENARQFREVQTRLERERASKEILDVISRSRDDEAPVFDIILENAARLCHAPHAFLMLRNEADTHLEFVAESFAKVSSIVDLKDHSYALDDKNSLTIQALNSAQVRHVPDLRAQDASYSTPMMAVAIEREGMRTLLYVPLLKDGRALGLIGVYKHEVAPFSDGEIALVETFAAQAVIAIENVRQFKELQTRLEREAATREVLSVISQSRDDEQPVFDLIVRLAKKLCGAVFAGLVLGREGDDFQRLVAHDNLPQDILDMWLAGQYTMERDKSLVANAILDCRVNILRDMADTDFHREKDARYKTIVTDHGLRSNLLVPLVQNGVGIGCLMLARGEVRPYQQDEVSLVESFAAQAVIAIENVRQFRELQDRLAREAATGDVLRVINQSRDDAQPVFHSIHDNAATLCNAEFSGLFLRNETGEQLELVSHRGGDDTYVATTQKLWSLEDPSAQCRAVLRKDVIHVRDLSDTDAYRKGHAPTVKAVEEEGIRTFLAVPLMKGDTAIGSIGVYRQEAGPFTDDQIELLKTFAAQAVIAIENVRQFKALAARTEEVQALNQGLESRVAEQVDELERLGRLKRFLPAQVADAVVSSGDDALLSSHRALIATLFCDIRGFTAFCENAEPEETIEVLQTYHEALGALISDHGAGVDHRAGDGIMVIFNDPLPCDDPAGEALRLAFAMRTRMAGLCAGWKRLGHHLGFGVGISLGYATVGLVGTEGRFDYTASGTAVNLAARLCEHAADGEILLSPRAAVAVEDAADLESAGELALKGFREPVSVKRVVGLNGTG